MLANTFLDHVLDEWFAQEGKPRMKGRCFLIRVADDFVIGCEREDDARRMLMVLPKRFARFQLTMHPPKSRLVPFQPPRQEGDGAHGDGTFDVLGLTHDWAKSRRGVLGDQAAHGQDAAAASDAGGVALVPHASARTAAGPIPGAVPEAARALPVLWYSRELPEAGSALSACGARVAVLVEPAWGATHHPVGDVCQPACGAGAAPTPYRASHLIRPAGQQLFCIRVVPTL